MFSQTDTCPYCKTALGRTELSAIRRTQQKWGWAGITLGLIGAGLGIYFGAAA